MRPGHWYTDGTRPLCYIDNAAGFWSPTTKEPLVAAGIASLAPLDVPPVREPDDFLEGLSADPADHIPGSWCIAEGVSDANFVFLHRADDSGITVVDIRPHAAGPRVHTLNAGRVTVSTTDRVDIPQRPALSAYAQILSAARCGEDFPVVEHRGIEPLTFALRTQRSTN